MVLINNNAPILSFINNKYQIILNIIIIMIKTVTIFQIAMFVEGMLEIKHLYVWEVICTVRHSANSHQK